jgi:hypothetical protein
MATSATATLYRKTAAGQAELTERCAGLTPRARTVLVVVNGVLTVARLVETLGPEVPTLLQTLLGKGLIEPVAAKAPAPSSTGVPMATAAPRPAPVVAGAPLALPPAPGPTPSVLRALLELLVPHFGPDATRVAEPALRATNAHDYHAALDALGARLAIHLGRKQAEQLLMPLRLPVG